MPIGSRIRLARQLNGLSLRALASQAEVTAQAISKYERDLMTPGSDVLLRLAHALGVRIEFFLRSDTLPEVVPHYRKAATLPRKKEAQLRGRVRERLERYVTVERLRALDRQGFAMPAGFPRRIRRMEEAESAAEALRDAWRLGLDPIENLTELLEEKGIRVEGIDGPAQFDACAFVTEGTSEIQAIVTRRDLPGDRQRFSLAHELGHIVLKPAPETNAEKAAHRFAGAFLAPAAAVRQELGTHRTRLSPTELHLLKHKYGLSMQAWILRARDVGAISPHLASQYFRSFRSRGWHRREPGNACPPERSFRFERLLLQALEEKQISERRAEELLGRPLAECINEISREHDGLPRRLRD